MSSIENCGNTDRSTIDICTQTKTEMSFETKILAAKCSDLHRLVISGDQKYLCFTKFESSSWVVCVTDGMSLWRQELDNEETDAVRDLAGINSIDAFLARFRNGFQTGDLSVVLTGNKVTLTIGKGSSSLNFDLFEAKAAKKSTELQSILFRLAESAASLASDLDNANQMVDQLKAQKGTNQVAPFMDLGPKKGQNPAKVKPKKTGMSVINPASKKRKPAAGVVFN